MNVSPEKGMEAQRGQMPLIGARAATVPQILGVPSNLEESLFSPEISPEYFNFPHIS